MWHGKPPCEASVLVPQVAHAQLPATSPVWHGMLVPWPGCHAHHARMPSAEGRRHKTAARCAPSAGVHGPLCTVLHVQSGMAQCQHPTFTGTHTSHLQHASLAARTVALMHAELDASHAVMRPPHACHDDDGLAAPVSSHGRMRAGEAPSRYKRAWQPSAERCAAAKGSQIAGPLAR